MSHQPVKLTQFSHGAGCGCKISPKTLKEILKSNGPGFPDSKLIIGNETNDDAAVYDLENGTALISTVDFFMPVVDDAFDFGRIAAANSLSDVYAMGGTPLLAISVFGWPVETLPAEEASRVIDGGRAICREAGIPLAGGHSIDSPEPLFGLAVTGRISLENLKKNNTAKAGDLLFLTKPLGSGILSTAQKRGLLKNEHLESLIRQLVSLNTIGEKLGKIKSVTAMTDVTGFGLLGHLIEMAEGSRLSAEIYYEKIPRMPGIEEYISQRVVPDATSRNWSSYGNKIRFEKAGPAAGGGINVTEAFSLLPDPQTNGGLLFSVDEHAVEPVVALLTHENLASAAEPIGRFLPGDQVIIEVKK